MKEHAHFGLWIRPNLANVDNKISLSIQGKFDRRIFILTRSIDFMYLTSAPDLYLWLSRKKSYGAPVLSSPCNTNEPISLCMHRILSLSICYFVTVLRNVLVLSIRPPHPLDSSLLLLCLRAPGQQCYQQRQYWHNIAPPGSLTKYVKLQHYLYNKVIIKHIFCFLSWYWSGHVSSCEDLHTFSSQN